MVTFDVTPDNARAREISEEMQRHKAYDTFYVELAERLGADLWTLDQGLAQNPRKRGRVMLVE